MAWIHSALGGLPRSRCRKCSARDSLSASTEMRLPLRA